MTQIDVEKLLEGAPEAVPLPATAMAILKKSNLPQTSAKDLGDILGTDEALSARVLKVANSAFYGLPRQVASVNEAVVLLGIRTIRNLALTASMSSIGHKAVAGYGLPEGELFKHSLVMARAASHVSRQTNKAVPDEAYTAGLLHDIGKLVLAQYVKAELAAITERALQDDVSFAHAERRSLGVGHAEIGAALAERWSLPLLLVNAIGSHHGFENGASKNGDTTSLAAVCILANHIGRNMGSGKGQWETPDPPIAAVILEILGMSADDLPDLEQVIGKNILGVAELVEAD